jgi:hypothetical protein
MAELNLSRATTTNLTSAVPDFIVESKTLDAASPDQKETYHYFSQAPERYGYYLSIPEVFSAVNAMATWAFGAGWSTENDQLRVELEHIKGMGKDTFLKIIWNLEVVKLVVGDAFAEVKREKNKIINMIPISPERVRVVFNEKGMIKRYDTWDGKDWKAIDKENMLHIQNKRIGDQIHGTSQFEAATFAIDAKNEALEDERIIKHRDKALGIVYYKTDKTGKIDYANKKIENAVKNGEMVGLPEGTASIEAYPGRSSEDRQDWIAYLENFIYQLLGVPRSIATSDGTSEVGGKMGNVNFEPNYAKERMDMEEDLWNQQAIKVKFEKQASLGGLVTADMQKNTGMTQIQPNDVTADMERE